MTNIATPSQRAARPTPVGDAAARPLGTADDPPASPSFGRSHDADPAASVGDGASAARPHGSSRASSAIPSADDPPAPPSLGTPHGAVPVPVSVFDDDAPAVARLDPDLLRALRAAATAAARDGVQFFVNGGWRSPRYQDQLLGRAIERYGSAAEAARWVATPETSAHVKGRAVDIGRSEAQAWLREHGAAFVLFPVYHNEPWHFELRREAIGGRRPPMYADPSHDPRLRRRVLPDH